MNFSFARAIATVGGLTMLSRVAGFARDILNAALLGAGPVSDAFFVALKLPNLFRRLFGEGAFSVAFVPLFNAELQGRGRAAAHLFAERCLAVMIAVVVPFSALMMWGMPWLMAFLAPGFADEPAKYGLAVELTRITFPYLLLISLVTLYGGVLNSLNSFGPFAAAPVAFNLVQILAMLLAWWIGGDVARMLAVAVTLSGAVQLVWMAWAAHRHGLSLRLRLPRFEPRVRRLFVLMGPAALGGGIMQVNVLVDLVLASLLPTGAVSYLYYADRLNQLPLGVIGIAVGTALLPVLSRNVEAGNHDAVRHYLSRGLEFALLLGLPAGVALVVSAHPVIQVLFERGAFGPADTAATAWALAAYALGIPAYVLVKVLSTAFFARQDTMGPVRIAVVIAVANGALGFVLIHLMGHVGIALATCVTAYLNVALLATGLRRRGHLTIDDRLKRRAPRLIVCAGAMGAALAAGGYLLAPWFAASLPIRFAALGLLVGAGAALYFVLAHLTGGAPLGEMKAVLRRKAPQPAS
ncbi:MAG TPA: murein biosynthesis integral membrane protein MurJ [Azospirillaceae bacterium]|nr:murein biosynthesis integral membrane protein MurJ [Azospirillaceae bacterium]